MENNENKPKRGRVWPIFKKNIARLFHFSIYCFYSAVGTMVVAIASYCTDASSNPDLGPYFIDSLEAKEISMWFFQFCVNVKVLM